MRKSSVIGNRYRFGQLEYAEPIVVNVLQRTHSGYVVNVYTSYALRMHSGLRCYVEHTPSALRNTLTRRVPLTKIFPTPRFGITRQAHLVLCAFPWGGKYPCCSSCARAGSVSCPPLESNEPYFGGGNPPRPLMPQIGYVRKSDSTSSRTIVWCAGYALTRMLFVVCRFFFLVPPAVRCLDTRLEEP